MAFRTLAAERYLQAGRFDDALAAFDSVLEEMPGDLAATSGRAAALRALGRPREALMALLGVISRSPQDKQARVEMARALKDLGRTEEARAVYSILCREPGATASAWHGLGELLLAERHDRAAETCLARALLIDASHVGARMALAGLKGRAGDYAGAADGYLDVLSFSPGNPQAHSGLARALMADGRLAEAGEQFDRALALDEDNVAAHIGRAQLAMLGGDIESCWEDFEWRWQLPGVRWPDLPGDVWDGSPLDGRCLLLFSERGIGETVQMLRYVPLLLGRGARVVLAVQPALAPLAETIPGVEAVLSAGQALPRDLGIDLHASLADLPHLFGTSLDTIPAALPYLSAPFGRCLPILAPPGIRLKIGLAWAGNLPAERLKSVPFTEIMGLLAARGAVFFGLQMPPANADIERFAHPALITDLISSVADFADLAGRIAELDLIITVDGPVADIAGALGKPVWLLLSAAPDPRWMLGRETSPWYPGMRLFRQERSGDWTGVLTRVSMALEALVAEHDDAHVVATRQARGPKAAMQAFLHAHVSEGDLLLDVGAGDGTFALDAAQHPSGDVHVLAVEADPHQAEILADTVAICGAEEVIEVVSAAVGESSGAAMIVQVPGRGRKVVALPDWLSGPVPVVALDTLLADRFQLSERRIVVRLGASGAEAAALAGLWEPLTTQRAAVLVFEHREGGQAAQILVDSGYSLHRFPSDLAQGGLVQFDGQPGAVLALAAGDAPLESYGKDDGAGEGDETPADSIALARAEAEGFFQQAILAQQAGRFGEAAHFCGRALGQDPTHAGANANLGFLARRMRRLEAAELCTRRALAEAPTPGLWSNLGNVLREMGRHGEAEAALLKALEAEPDNPAFLYNLALVERERGRAREAVALFERCCALSPERPPEAELAEALMKAGDFAKGFPALARRPRPDLPTRLPGVAWAGGDLDARSILVHDELDAADTVMMARFIPLIARHGGLVTLTCQPEIAGLMETVAGVERVVPWGTALPPCDTHVSILDIPALIGTDSRALPRDVPYLHLPEGRSAFRFPEDGRLRIGLVWSGRPGTRLVPLTQLMGLAAAHAGIHLISLQQGERAADLVEAGARAFVEDMGVQFESFDDCAAVMAGLDLVVAVDGPEAHIAAAMGKPVWVALPVGAGWRWVDGRDDSPWYPTMRVFRQTADGSWSRAFARMSDLAAAMAAGKARG